MVTKTSVKKIGVTGHQKIPAVAMPHVRAGIERVLASASGSVVGLTSLAAGADQLFARAVLGRGGSLHAIIPCEGYESTFTNEKDLAAFRELFARASEVETLPHASPSEQAFLEAGRRVVELADLLIAVWDGEAAQGLGGTADIVKYARDRSREVTIVWPAGVSR
jgi:hypothetical protein